MNTLSPSNLLVYLVFCLSSLTGASALAAECIPRNEIKFKSWQQWHPITSEPIRSEGHENDWVGIFVDRRAKENYVNKSGPYPPCAKIAKAHYETKAGVRVKSLTVMFKMPPGYDPKNGDWWYATYDKTGEIITGQGRIHHCISCHEQATKTDYLFSNEVSKAIENNQ